jgi:dTDP-4-amino-4,6-dideoxyglucose
VRRLINRRTAGIMAVHLWGRPSGVEELTAVARAAGVPLFYDAAHAFATTYKGTPVGGFGDGEIFSFHSTKFVNSFEGGALVTNDDRLAARAVSLRNFGITGPDTVTFAGVNAKMSEASAAMGLTSLDSLEEVRAHNRRIYHAYRDGLAGLPAVNLLSFDEREQHNFQYVVLELDERRTAMTRDLMVRLLHAENVLVRRYFHPGCHRMAPYRNRTRLPHTELLASRSIVLPTGMAVSEWDAARVCQLIHFGLAHAAELPVHHFVSGPVRTAA